jgi:hypothetical protein
MQRCIDLKLTLLVRFGLYNQLILRIYYCYSIKEDKECTLRLRSGWGPDISTVFGNHTAHFC